MNGLLEPEVRTPGREPSPQPTHLSVPNGGSHHRIIHDQSTGYVAPKFEGKERQMEQGE
jgi:glutamate dehydrogenase